MKEQSANIRLESSVIFRVVLALSVIQDVAGAVIKGAMPASGRLAPGRATCMATRNLPIFARTLVFPTLNV